MLAHTNASCAWWSHVWSSWVADHSCFLFLSWAWAGRAFLAWACLSSIFSNVNSSTKLEAVCLYCSSCSVEGFAFTRAELRVGDIDNTSTWGCYNSISNCSKTICNACRDLCTTSSNCSGPVVPKVRSIRWATCAERIINSKWRGTAWCELESHIYCWAVCCRCFGKVVIEQGLVGKWVITVFLLD